MKWINNESYLHPKDVIQSIKVVNYAAGRGFKLMEEYNTKFTKKRRLETV